MTIAVTTIWLLGAFFVLTLATLQACATSPTGRKQMAFVSEAQLTEMGDQAWAETKKATPETKDQATKDFVNNVARQVVATTPLAGEKWDLTVFESKEINAFALPGGHIGVFTGILPVAENAAALAAVLGHEIGHVTANHHAERVSEQLVANGVLSGASIVLGGQNHNVLMAALGLGAQVGFLLPYSRQQESEADAIGLQYMAQAGYDPHEAIALWERMQKATEGQEPPAFMSSHPPTAERIAKLKELLPTALENYAKSSKQQGVGGRVPATVQ